MPAAKLGRGGGEVRASCQRTLSMWNICGRYRPWGLIVEMPSSGVDPEDDKSWASQRGCRGAVEQGSLYQPPAYIPSQFVLTAAELGAGLWVFSSCQLKSSKTEIFAWLETHSLETQECWSGNVACVRAAFIFMSRWFQDAQQLPLVESGFLEKRGLVRNLYHGCCRKI